MADEFNTGTNWWDSSRTAAGSSSSSSGLNNSLGSYGNWPNEGTTRSSMDNSVSSVSGSSVVFHENNPKLQSMDLQMMGLGLSSQAMDWNHQALLRGEKGSESSFRSMLQDHNYHHHQHQQQQQQQMNRGFSLDQFSPHGSSSDSTVTGQSLPSSFQMDSTALYASPSTILQGLLGSDQNQPQQQQQSSINYQYGAMNTNEQLLPNSWSKVPQFLRNSPPKQQQQNQLHGQLHFSNNAPFWNPSAGAAASMVDHQVRPGFYPSFQTGNFDEKPKNISEVRDTSTVVKKSGNEPASNKRTRNETPSTTMPAFKVRKEKMGDRITALQQLVSPFGKTDTASVLSEAIEYIKFLHEQVSVLSTPYMKNDQAAIQHQQHNLEKSKDPEGPKQDLRSRGLCLVPVSSTFPLTHDSPVDFWTPTFGGTFR